MYRQQGQLEGIGGYPLAGYGVRQGLGGAYSTSDYGLPSTYGSPSSYGYGNSAGGYGTSANSYVPSSGYGSAPSAYGRSDGYGHSGGGYGGQSYASHSSGYGKPDCPGIPISLLLITLLGVGVTFAILLLKVIGAGKRRKRSDEGIHLDDLLHLFTIGRETPAR